MLKVPARSASGLIIFRSRTARFSRAVRLFF